MTFGVKTAKNNSVQENNAANLSVRQTRRGEKKRKWQEELRNVKNHMVPSWEK